MLVTGSTLNSDFHENGAESNPSNGVSAQESGLDKQKCKSLSVAVILSDCVMTEKHQELKNNTKIPVPVTFRNDIYQENN